MSKFLFNKLTYLILVIGLGAAAFCQTSSGTSGDFIRPFPSPTPTPKPTPSPTPTPTPTPTPAPNSTMGAIINQRGFGTTNSPGINVGGAASLLGSRSYTYSVPMFALPGRHGLNLDLSLYYNSLIWETVAGGGVTYSPEGPSPSTGFRLDYGYIQWDDSVTTTGVLVDAKGAKHPLVAATQFGTQFNTIDSTYISVQHHTGTSSTDIDSDVVTYKNGSQTFYQEAPGSAQTCCPGSIAPSDTHLITRPVKIEDTSGNFITINYSDNFSTSLSSVVDTAGRTITFIYANGLLNCVTDAVTCNAAGSRTFNFSWNSQYILNYQFSQLITSPWAPIPPLQGSSFPYTVLSGVTRPDGTGVQFNYGDWMIVNDIRELSTNGSVRYETNYNFPAASAGPLDYPPTYTQQTVTTVDKDGNPKQATWSYQTVISSPAPSEKLVSCVAVTDPLGTIHLTTLSAQGNIFDGLPIKSTVATGSTAPCTTPPAVVLRSSITQWTTDTDSSGLLNGLNPRIQTVTTILSDGLTQSQIQIAYDGHGNQIDAKHFDFGSGKPGPLLRETVATYATNLGNIFNLPTDMQIKDGSGSVLSHQTFTYDDYGTTQLKTVSPLPPGFDNINFGAATGPPRGNLTGETFYTNAAAGTGPLSTTFTYDILGNALTSKAGCCRQAVETFSSNTQYTFPDSVSVGPSGSQLTTSYLYDMGKGRAIVVTDANGQQTHLTYDVDNRPANTTTADGVITTFNYDDAAVNPVTTLSNTGNSLVIKATQDGLGRALKEQVLSGSSLIRTTSRINDALGRPMQVSNPYGPADPVLYSNYVYDELGRLISVTQPALAGTTQNSSQFKYSAGTFSDSTGSLHSGQSLQLTDPAGKSRLQFTDGLGRLVRVDEPGGQPLSLTTPNSTFYSYDALGNLLQVLQGQQTRTYQYDSLSRVISSTIPETGYQAATAAYSDSGTLSHITDPRLMPNSATHLSTTFAYDMLNRPKTITFGDGSTVSYTYNPPGSAHNTGGRLAAVSNAVATHTYQYDIMGRLSNVSQSIGGQVYNIGYQYHPDGTLASITYPSGRIVATDEDSIGRVSQIKNNGTSLLSIDSYNAIGDALHETYADGITGVYSYDNHLQIASRNYSSATGSLLNLTYNYGGAQNNGQIASITDGMIPEHSTNYTYDALSRLITAGTSNLVAPNTWQLQFAYDRYGNRLSETPSGGTASMPSGQLPVDSATNHIACGGCTYDAAGNMTSDGLFNYSFDAIGEMAAVTPLGSNSPVATFGYDPGGLRVIKNGTVYIYSNRKVIAEYSAGTAATSPNVEYIYRGKSQLATIAAGVITYHFGDHISSRFDADSTGKVVRTFGSYPFGETWYETGVLSKWKFSTYENDAESGLNYAIARFQSPRLGRFMSVDSLAGQHTNPQSLNRYAYVNNDPINLTDPSGMECVEGCDDDEGGGGGGDGGGGDGGAPGGDDGGSGDGGFPDTIVLCLPMPSCADGVSEFGSLGQPIDLTTLIDGESIFATVFGFEPGGSDGPAPEPADEPSIADLTPAATVAPNVNTGSTQAGGLDLLQGGLMVAGFIPGVGDVANGINAVISLARGNYKDAALYGLSAIPFAGILGEAAIAAREVESGVNAGRELLLDTNVVVSDGRRLLSSGDNIVKASVSDTELANLVEAGRIKMPRAAADIPSVADSLNVNLRINVRELLTPKVAGNFADGIIGATALERDAILISRDEALIDAVNKLGGIARKP
jgi:RHS repeat-associated protein